MGVAEEESMLIYLEILTPVGFVLCQDRVAFNVCYKIADRTSLPQEILKCFFSISRTAASLVR